MIRIGRESQCLPYAGFLKGETFYWNPPKLSNYKIPFKQLQNLPKCQRLQRDV